MASFYNKDNPPPPGVSVKGAEGTPQAGQSISQGSDGWQPSASVPASTGGSGSKDAGVIAQEQANIAAHFAAAGGVSQAQWDQSERNRESFLNSSAGQAYQRQTGQQDVPIRILTPESQGQTTGGGYTSSTLPGGVLSISGTDASGKPYTVSGPGYAGSGTATTPGYAGSGSGKESYESWASRNVGTDPYRDVKGANVNVQAKYYREKYPNVDWEGLMAGSYVGQGGVGSEGMDLLTAQYIKDIKTNPNAGNAAIALYGGKMERGEFTITQSELRSLASKDLVKAIGDKEQVSRAPTNAEINSVIRLYEDSARKGGYTVVNDAGAVVQPAQLTVVPPGQGYTPSPYAPKGIGSSATPSGTVEAFATLTTPTARPDKTMSSIASQISGPGAGIYRVVTPEYVPSPRAPGYKAPTIAGAPKIDQNWMAMGKSMAFFNPEEYKTKPLAPAKTAEERYAELNPDQQFVVARDLGFPMPEEKAPTHMEVEFERIMDFNATQITQTNRAREVGTEKWDTTTSTSLNKITPTSVITTLVDPLTKKETIVGETVAPEGMGFTQESILASYLAEMKNKGYEISPTKTGYRATLRGTEQQEIDYGPAGRPLTEKELYLRYEPGDRANLKGMWEGQRFESAIGGASRKLDEITRQPLIGGYSNPLRIIPAIAETSGKIGNVFGRLSQQEWEKTQASYSSPDLPRGIVGATYHSGLSAVYGGLGATIATPQFIYETLPSAAAYVGYVATPTTNLPGSVYGIQPTSNLESTFMRSLPMGMGTLVSVAAGKSIMPGGYGYKELGVRAVSGKVIGEQVEGAKANPAGFVGSLGAMLITGKVAGGFKSKVPIREGFTMSDYYKKVIDSRVGRESTVGKVTAGVGAYAKRQIQKVSEPPNLKNVYSEGTLTIPKEGAVKVITTTEELPGERPPFAPDITDVVAGPERVQTGTPRHEILYELEKKNMFEEAARDNLKTADVNKKIRWTFDSRLPSETQTNLKETISTLVKNEAIPLDMIKRTDINVKIASKGYTGPTANAAFNPTTNRFEINFNLLNTDASMPLTKSRVGRLLTGDLNSRVLNEIADWQNKGYIQESLGNKQYTNRRIFLHEIAHLKDFEIRQRVFAKYKLSPFEESSLHNAGLHFLSERTAELDSIVSARRYGSAYTDAQIADLTSKSMDLSYRQGKTIPFAKLIETERVPVPADLKPGGQSAIDLGIPEISYKRAAGRAFVTKAPEPAPILPDYGPKIKTTTSIKSEFDVSVEGHADVVGKGGIEQPIGVSATGRTTLLEEAGKTTTTGKFKGEVQGAFGVDKRISDAIIEIDSTGEVKPVQLSGIQETPLAAPKRYSVLGFEEGYTATKPLRLDAFQTPDVGWKTPAYTRTQPFKVGKRTLWQVPVKVPKSSVVRKSFLDLTAQAKISPVEAPTLGLSPLQEFLNPNLAAVVKMDAFSTNLGTIGTRGRFVDMAGGKLTETWSLSNKKGVVGKTRANVGGVKIKVETETVPISKTEFGREIEPNVYVKDNFITLTRTTKYTASTDTPVLNKLLGKKGGYAKETLKISLDNWERYKAQLQGSSKPSEIIKPFESQKIVQPPEYTFTPGEAAPKAPTAPRPSESVTKSGKGEAVVQKQVVTPEDVVLLKKIVNEQPSISQPTLKAAFEAQLSAEQVQAGAATYDALAQGFGAAAGPVEVSARLPKIAYRPTQLYSMSAPQGTRTASPPIFESMGMSKPIAIYKEKPAYGEQFHPELTINLPKERTSSLTFSFAQTGNLEGQLERAISGTYQPPAPIGRVREFELEFAADKLVLSPIEITGQPTKTDIGQPQLQLELLDQPSPPPPEPIPGYGFDIFLPGPRIGVPFIPLPPPGGGGGGGGAFKPMYASKKKSFYLPSLVGIELGIRSTGTQAQLSKHAFTGGEIRGLPSEFFTQPTRRAPAPTPRKAPVRNVPNMKQVYSAIGGFKAPKARKRR